MVFYFGPRPDYRCDKSQYGTLKYDLVLTVIVQYTQKLIIINASV